MARKYVYELDNSAIIHLATLRKNDSNVFRIELNLTEPVDQAVLQTALDRVVPRFPTIAAGIWQGWFRCGLVPVRHIPAEPDPGILLTMTRAEIDRCALRIYYRDNLLSGEFFHSLSDGTGAGIFMKTLLAEYLRLRHGIAVEDPQVLPLDQAPQPAELVDDFYTYSGGPKASLDNGASYQVPGRAEEGSRVEVRTMYYDVPVLKAAAKRYGVTINTLLTAVMARTVAQVQQRDIPARRGQTIRFMVPMNLRRLFPSITLRNFSYFVLPSIPAGEGLLPMQHLVDSIQKQLSLLCTREAMQAAITTNTSLERTWILRCIPLPLKRLILRQANLLFGAKASCMSLSNLGIISVPEAMNPYVQDVRYMLTPRIQSPYNCTVSTFGSRCGVTFTLLNDSAGLADLFRVNMEQILSEN